MYHKNNPWISLVALLLMVLIIVLNCTGCTAKAAETAPRFTTKRAGAFITVITDNETGAEYLVYNDKCITMLEG